jgi:hypothetical protein
MYLPARSAYSADVQFVRVLVVVVLKPDELVSLDVVLKTVEEGKLKVDNDIPPIDMRDSLHLNNEMSATGQALFIPEHPSCPAP